MISPCPTLPLPLTCKNKIKQNKKQGPSLWTVFSLLRLQILEASLCLFSVRWRRRGCRNRGGGCCCGGSRWGQCWQRRGGVGRGGWGGGGRSVARSYRGVRVWVAYCSVFVRRSDVGAYQPRGTVQHSSMCRIVVFTEFLLVFCWGLFLLLYLLDTYSLTLFFGPCANCLLVVCVWGGHLSVYKYKSRHTIVFATVEDLRRKRLNVVDRVTVAGASEQKRGREEGRAMSARSFLFVVNHAPVDTKTFISIGPSITGKSFQEQFPICIVLPSFDAVFVWPSHCTVDDRHDVDVNGRCGRSSTDQQSLPWRRFLKTKIRSSRDDRD